jgi:hypothetical protein
VIKWRYCDCGAGYRGILKTCPDCRSIEGRKPQVGRVRKRKPRICRSPDCMEHAAVPGHYCRECRARLDAANTRTAEKARVRIHSPEMQASARSIAEQVALMARIDPFYRGGPA